jgi:hypothetical protein
MAIKRNLHTIDRAIRLIIGVGSLVLTIGTPQVIGNDLVNLLVGLFGIVNIVAAVVANCPVYHVAGLSTYKDKACEKQ